MALALVIGGCASGPSAPPAARPEDVRARIAALLPTSVPDRQGWAVDLYAAFAALNIAPSTEHLCQVLAVAEQESG